MKGRTNKLGNHLAIKQQQNQLLTKSAEREGRSVASGDLQTCGPTCRSPEVSPRPGSERVPLHPPRHRGERVPLHPPCPRGERVPLHPPRPRGERVPLHPPLSPGMSVSPSILPIHEGERVSPPSSLSPGGELTSILPVPRVSVSHSLSSPSPGVSMSHLHPPRPRG